MEKMGRFFLDTAEVIVFAGAIFLFVYFLVMQPHKIKGSSMEPNFHDGEYLLSDKLTYRFAEPQRGDVIVFKAPEANGDEFIKRIIGLPGDVISISDSFVHLNGKPLVESYIPEYSPTNPGAFLQSGKQITVPTNHFFVLGDNRNHSSDSRAWGFIEKEDITGKAWFVYYPLNEAGVLPEVDYSS